MAIPIRIIDHQDQTEICCLIFRINKIIKMIAIIYFYRYEISINYFVSNCVYSYYIYIHNTIHILYYMYVPSLKAVRSDVVYIYEYE